MRHVPARAALACRTADRAGSNGYGNRALPPGQPEPGKKRLESGLLSEWCEGVPRLEEDRVAVTMDESVFETRECAGVVAEPHLDLCELDRPAGVAWLEVSGLYPSVFEVRHQRVRDGGLATSCRQGLPEPAVKALIACHPVIRAATLDMSAADSTTPSQSGDGQ